MLTFAFGESSVREKERIKKKEKTKKKAYWDSIEKKVSMIKNKSR